MSPRISTLTPFLLIAALLVPWWQESVRAETKVVGSFDEVVADAAEQVLKITANQPVIVGQFTPTFLPDSNSGPAIAELLKKALGPDFVKRDALFEVKGDYTLREVDQSRDAQKPGDEFRLSDHAPNHLKVIELTFRVSTRTGEKKTFDLARFVDDNKSIGQILQVSGFVQNGTGSDREERLKRNRILAELGLKGKSFVDPAAPTIVKSVKESPYAIEILAEPLAEHLKHENQPGAHHPRAIPAKIDPESGLAFVEIPRDFIYEIHALNNSGKEAAVAVNIDGLDIFHFSEDVGQTGKPLYSHLVFDKETAIVGWHKSVAKARFDSFLVTEYGKGASSQAGIPAAGPVGVIQVVFSESLPLPAGKRPRSTANETGFGPPRHVDQKPVAREITKPVDFITVRYTR
jgi:hypothetical protein